MAYATLILFCKRPALGFGKQRLAASLGEQAAFEIAQSLLACALEDLADWPGDVVISPSCDKEVPWAEALLSRAVTVISQPEGNLGVRLQRVDEQLRVKGQHKLMIIGSDAPELSQLLLQHASTLLDMQDIVFSAAEDGGVSLMGAAKPWPMLKSMPWSTEQLAGALVSGCEAENYSVAWVEPCSDVDIKSDLERLSESLKSDLRESRQALLQTINGWL